MTPLKRFIASGLLITVVSIIIRAVSVSFNVYVSNKIGAVAMGLFTLINTVYTFAITVATSGIGLATTRMIAQAATKTETASNNANNILKDNNLQRIVKKCVIYALCFSLGSALILFIFSPIIGEKILKDTRTILSLRILAFTLPPISLTSVFNGYFIAVRRVYKNAIVQILGQAIRIYGCIALLFFFGADDVESACLAIVAGGALSEAISFSIHYLLYIFEKKKTYSKEKNVLAIEKTNEKQLLSIALPVAFSAYIRSALVTIEHMLIPWGLERSGNSRDISLAAYGTVHSMVFPFVLFPSAISGSFAGLLVPEIAQSSSSGDQARIERIIERVFKCVLVFSIGIAGIFMCFSYSFSKILFPQINAGKYILMISPLIPVMYLDTAVDSILKGMGEQFYCMCVNIVDSLMSVILVCILIPKFGIIGYIMTVYFTEIVNATLSISRLFSISKAKTHVFDWLIKPIICIISATSIMRYLLNHLSSGINSGWVLGAYVYLTTIIYILFLLLLKNKRNRKTKEKARKL